MDISKTGQKVIKNIIKPRVIQAIYHKVILLFQCWEQTKMERHLLAIAFKNKIFERTLSSSFLPALISIFLLNNANLISTFLFIFLIKESSRLNLEILLLLLLLLHPFKYSNITFVFFLVFTAVCKLVRGLQDMLNPSQKESQKQWIMLKCLPLALFIVFRVWIFLYLFHISPFL